MCLFPFLTIKFKTLFIIWVVFLIKFTQKFISQKSIAFYLVYIYVCMYMYVCVCMYPIFQLIPFDTFATKVVN